MKRPMLALASLAVATAACLAVMYALREEPPAPGTEPVASASVGEAPSPPAPPVTAAPPPVPDPAADAPAPAPPPDSEADLAERVRQAEAQEQALRDLLLGVAKDDSLPLEARLDRYREAIERAREAHPDAPIFRFHSMLTELFLRMEPVQRELAALSPEARANALAHIRRELGYDEAGIARMAELDARREARWQTGLAYMEERRRLTTTFEGEALETELRALRNEYFGPEAPTIEAEEQQGFFRFERPRIYGRN